MDVDTVANRYDLVAHPVRFVMASEEDHQQSLKKTKKFPTNQLSGEQAKKIYEDILNEESLPDANSQGQHKSALADNTPSRIRKKWRERRRKTLECYSNADLFRAAEGGDLETVKKCMTDAKLNINSVDAFSWTPLMMAAHMGHENVVLFLLTEGAEWLEQIDGSGYDARDLACLGGHRNIADILMNSEKHVLEIKVEQCKKRVMRTIKREKVWCEVCKCHYFAPAGRSRRDPHLSSTLHLVSDKESLQPRQSHFYIPGSNRGYQLLRKDGWDGNSGLGPSGAGQKYPVKTVLKRDRLGFGASKRKARVTHFAANDQNAVKRRRQGETSGIGDRTSKSFRKNIGIMKKDREKQKEIDFRRLFY